jgi:hypothetical protein
MEITLFVTKFKNMGRIFSSNATLKLVHERLKGQMEASVQDWWVRITLQNGGNNNSLASLAMLISWEVWKEHNARIFRSHASMSIFIIMKPKDEGMAGAKFFGTTLPGE